MSASWGGSRMSASFSMAELEARSAEIGLSLPGYKIKALELTPHIPGGLLGYVAIFSDERSDTGGPKYGLYSHVTGDLIYNSKGDTAKVIRGAGFEVKARYFACTLIQRMIIDEAVRNQPPIDEETVSNYFGESILKKDGV